MRDLRGICVNVADRTTAEPSTRFVGRARELHELSELLEGRRLVTLVGAGGSGKTRLALRLAAEEPARGGPQPVVVSLEAMNDAAGPFEALVQALGVTAPLGHDPFPAIARWIGDAPRLVVLDNCEHLRAPVAELVARLMHSCPHLTVLATSRESLGVAGEVVWVVPSLSLDTPSGDSDAVALFRDRVALVAPELQVDAVVIEEICRSLDGLPLAIELAAARSRVMTPREIAAEVHRPLFLLRGGSASLAPRLRTMRASIAWSHSLLTAPEQRMLRRLAIFEGGFFADAAEQVCGDGEEESSTLDLLSGLVEKSLVQTETTHDRMRFRLLEVVRHFAGEQLSEARERSLIRERHLEYMVGFAEAAGQPPLGERAAREWLLEVEFPNLRSAVRSATEQCDERGLRVLLATTLFMRESGRVREARILYEGMLTATAASRSSLRARALAAASTMAIMAADYPRTVQLCEAAIELGEEIGEPLAVAGGLVRLAVLEPDVARQDAMLRRAIEIADAAGDLVLVGDAFSTLTVATGLDDDIEGAAHDLAELERVSAAAENRVAAAYGLWERCRQGIALGDPVTLARNGEELLESALTIRDPIMRVVANLTLASAAAQRGDVEAWQGRLLDELAIAEQEGAVATVCAELGLGWIALSRDDADGVRRHASSILSRDVVYGTFVLGAQWLLLQAALLVGDIDLIRHEADQLAERAAALGNRRMEAMARIGRARAALLDGRVNRAEAQLEAAVDVLFEQAWLVDQADALETLGAVAARHQRWERAVRLMSAVAAWREGRSLLRLPPNAGHWNQVLIDARAALGEEAFAAAWERGAGLSLADANELARRRGGRQDRPRSGVGSLTGAELQVAELAAAGLRNVEIAERLFVARGTVKVHLSHVYAKLGVANRTELARLWASQS
jgi:predicted ATPase/DNA-binding NarL/FixJ family response regulator